MSKLIMMRGLPASGKSTEAKKMAEEYGNFTRVNRDLLRDMLHFGKWTGRNEGVVVDIEKRIVRELLLNGRNVIVDDCNLGQQHRQMWSSIAQESNAKFEVKMIDVSVATCLERDFHREKRVGHNVIMGMAMQYDMFPKPEKGFILIDIDGTLANIDHRLHYVKNENKNWKGFFATMAQDCPRVDVYMEHIRPLIEEGYTPVIVSGRPDNYRGLTQKWLAYHFPELWEQSVALFMRRADDKRPDTDVKSDIYRRQFEGRYNVHRIIDDRPSVIRMWKEHGLEVIDVGAGVEF